MTIDTQTVETASMRFDILKAALCDGTTRLGRLSFAGRATVETPTYIAVTSRGAIPHLTPDNVSKHMNVGGVYMALEDFIERPQAYSKRTPPLYQTPTTQKHTTRLHAFTATPSSITTILSPRRLPAVPSPLGNTSKAISVFTSTGFQPLTIVEYISAAQTLQPDIVIPPSDLTHNDITPNSKRALRMAERTDEWIVDWFASAPATSSTFAPILPIPYSVQWEYVARLAEDYLPTGQLSGLALYDMDVLPDLLSFQPTLGPLPRLVLSNPQTPHQLLRQISLGADVFALPFVNTLSDAGLALTFAFPRPQQQNSPRASSSP
ncbi:queuine tRNA-ribosyltransferase-like protein [Thermochaetoides thermophila DSM 1495]|uniref:Queuine tRNA-ribosyltransferase-like protein n=1 Tax=Chaetomium thermophilum (strain DSM 1495 / CBS 144.50 / IMI 039719) TaxID=759272 RepID=G0SGK6_CHATD|nr:queuine tRNA-ribosyltransferase-like protein [Thermochaetoides thermophila DSM 1495]EGS17345.1 queuine tRNA-ribosyltransferase-like protein [Thermochaetoides thermophila DSM 1495]